MTIYRPYYLLIIGCMLVFSPFSFAQYQWELAKEKDGISVYTSPVSGSSFDASKVSSEIEASLSVVTAIFQDVEHFTDLFASTQSARLLERSGETYQVHYIVSEAPWPVSDRDGIYTYRFNYQAAAKQLTIEQRNKPTYLPEESGMVRIPKCQGTWTFKELGNGRLAVTYIFHAEPGGSIPAWAANMGTVDLPFETMENLKQRIKQTKYQGKSYQFLE